eukprot:403375083
MRDIKESYSHMASTSKAGDVEKSQVKIGKNPHQEILDKLMNRPFLKHKVMTSRSVKSFMFDIFEDGLKEDMVIFEPNFVRKYPDFSTKYLDLHFNYDHIETGPTSSNDTDFLITYDRIVQPRRWQKPYTDIKSSYTNDTLESVFQSRENQNQLFKEPKQRKPYQVFRCKSKTKIEQGKNLIMESLKHKINQQLLHKSETFQKNKFDAYKQRKDTKTEQNLELPALTFEEKKDLVIQSQKSVNKMKRAISEQVINEDIEIEDDFQSSKQGKKYNRQQSLNILHQSEMQKNTYSRYNDSFEKDMNALSSKKPTILIRESQFGSNRNSSLMFPSINNQSSFASQNQSQQAARKNHSKKREEIKEYSDEVKKHIEVTSIIKSLYHIIGQIIKEKEAKNPNLQKLEDHIEMAAIFIEKLYDQYEEVQSQKLQPQIIEVIERIDNLIYLTHEFVENKQFEKEKLMQESKLALKDSSHKQLKASLLQKLTLIQLKKNQLRNTDHKFKKFYDRSKQEQAHEMRQFLKTNNSYLKSNQNHIMNRTRISMQSNAEKQTLDSTNIMNQMPSQDITANDLSLSIIQSPILKEQQPINQQLILVQDQNLKAFKPNFNFKSKQNSKKVNSNFISVEKIESFRRDINEPSIILPSSDVSPQKEENRRPTITSKLELRTPMSSKLKLQLMAKKKHDMNSFNKLVESKDLTLVNQSTDVSQAIKKCLKEFKPYEYYDEVINEYFGGHLNLDHIQLPQKDSSQDIANLETENQVNDQVSNDKKQTTMRQVIVQSTLKELLILAKENAMTNKKAICSIENHVQNEKLMNFKQKQEKATLIEYLKQLPNKKSSHLEDDDEYLEEFYDYEDKSNSKQNSARKNYEKAEDQNKLNLVKGHGKFSNLNIKMQKSMQKKYMEEKKKKVGFDSMIFVQDLKMFHNEFEIPAMLDGFLKKYGQNGDVVEFQMKNLVFYRKQLDSIEQKLIKLIQKFN